VGYEKWLVRFTKALSFGCRSGQASTS